MALIVAVTLAALTATAPGVGIDNPPNVASSVSAAASTPWTPPDPASPELIPYLRNTSRPKLAYSTWVGWYTDGGLNETTLLAQVDAMATRLRFAPVRVSRLTCSMNVFVSFALEL